MPKTRATKTKATNTLRCKFCGSAYLTKSGKGWRAGVKHQRYQCQDCGRIMVP